MKARRDTASRRMIPGAKPPNRLQVWNLPNETPGTLVEIFAAQDSRRSNLILYELQKVDAFRKCSNAIGAPIDPYDLIMSVGNGIACHLGPGLTTSRFKRHNRQTAKYARDAAIALENLSASFKDFGALGWIAPKLWSFPDPTDDRTIQSLFNLANGLDQFFERNKQGMFKDEGGRPKKTAFQRLIAELAGTYERATGKRATAWKGASGVWGGNFLKFVEVVLPVVRAIVKVSGVARLDEPISRRARGEFIEDLLKERRKRKNIATTS
jgi:hypothetical protein